MAALHLFLLVACLAMHASAQCLRADHPNCANWINNGFCNNAFYTLAMKQQYCPLSCPGICGVPPPAPPTTTTAKPTVIENANCGKWNSDPAIAFCVKANAEQKKLFCVKTCAFEIAPSADCAVYGTSNGVFMRMSTTNRNPGVAVPISNSASVVPQYVYAGSTCTVTLYEVPAIAVLAGTSDPEGGTFPGAAGNFQKITNPGSISYICACS